MNIWVTYSDYRIDLINPTMTFGIIFGVLFIIIAISLKRTENNFFDIPTTTSMKGLAVLFLIFGHLSLKCLQDKMFFNLGGYWAVIIFLFLSGYGLYQSYGLGNLRKGFWKNRISKLYIPLWLTLGLFIILDYFLINLNHSIFEIVLNFLGIHFNDILIRVNAVAWFIEYIMVLYIAYWVVSKLHFSEEIKLILLFLSCFFISVTVYLTPIKQYHSIWIQYTFTFPIGVLFGKYQNLLRNSLAKMVSNKFYFLIPSFLLFIFFNKWDSVFILPVIGLLRPLTLIASIIFIALLLEEINIQSQFLLFLGRYSYEIYLLHAPFMVKYDFFLHREPLFVYFYVYFLVLLFLSFLLARVSDKIHISIFSKEFGKYNKANSTDSKKRSV